MNLNPPPPRTLNLGSEGPGPEVINRRPRTEPLVIVATPSERSAQSEITALTPKFASIVPQEGLFEEPEPLRIPHSTDRATNLDHRHFVVFPAIGQVIESIEGSSNSMASENDRETPKPAPLNLRIAASEDEATPTPPNTGIEGLDPAFDQPTDIIPGFIAQTTSEGPILGDLDLPFHGESGATVGGPSHSVQWRAESPSEAETSSAESSSRRSRGTQYLIRRARQEKEAAERRARDEAAGLNLRELLYGCRSALAFFQRSPTASTAI